MAVQRDPSLDNDENEDYNFYSQIEHFVKTR